MPARRPSVADARHRALVARVKNLSAFQQGEVMSGARSAGDIERRLTEIERWNRSDERHELLERFNGDENRALDHFKRMSAIGAYDPPPPTLTNMYRPLETIDDQRSPEPMSTPRPATPDLSNMSTKQRVTHNLAAGNEQAVDLDNPDQATHYLGLVDEAKHAGVSVEQAAQNRLQAEKVERARAAIEKHASAKRAAQNFGGRPEDYGTHTLSDPLLRERAESFGVKPEKLAALGAPPPDDASDEEKQSYQDKLQAVASEPRLQKENRAKRQRRIAELQDELASLTNPVQKQAVASSLAKALEEEANDLKED